MYFLLYSLASTGTVRLIIYDVRGRRLRTLVQGKKAAGHHEEIWDGRDDRGRCLSSGLYLYRLETGDYRESRKLMVLK